MRAFYDFFSAFRYFLLCAELLLNYFLIILLTFSQISFYFSKNSLSFKKRYKNDMHSVSSKFLLYVVIFGKNIHKGLISLASLKYLANKVFKIFFIKMKFIRYLLDIYQNRDFILMKFVFSHFPHHQTLQSFCSLLYTILNFFYSFFNL